MSWNEPIIEQLRTLWHEGRSGSQIARLINSEHGTQFTRNAIIGKVHRLGSANREVPRRTHTSSKSNKRLPPTPIVEVPEPEPIALSTDSSVRLTIATVGAGQCRWPHGDPMHPDFHLCGAQTRPCAQYCDHHLRRAYRRNPNPRRKDSPSELAEIARNARALEAA